MGFKKKHTFSTFEEMIARPDEEQYKDNHDRSHGGGLVASLRTPMPDGSTHDLKVYIFAGIIDVLQGYGVKKQLEHVWKSLVHNGDECSVHNPEFYRTRFINFMNGTVFRPDKSRDKIAASTGAPFTVSLNAPLGLAISGHARGVYITRVKRTGSAVEHPAIKVGCRVLSIDGTSLAGKSKSDAVAMIRSAGSVPLAITFQPDGNHLST